MSSCSPTGWSSDSGCRAHPQDARGLVHRDAGRIGRVFHAGLRAVLLEQLAVHAPHAAHRLDHVDRHADRAALVGDRSGDGLANPPRRIGRELVAAGALELVDRSHQARVALLDQVQEAQAAVAIALGDRNDEPEVAGRQPALGRLIVVREKPGPGHSSPQRGRALQRDPHQVTEFLVEFLATRGRVRAPVQLLDLGLQIVHLPGDLPDLLKDRL